MADGDDDASVAQRSDVFWRISEVGRQGDQFDEIPGGSLPAVEFGDRRRTNVFAGMGTARTSFRREVRAFNVGAGDHMLECGVELPRCGDRAEAGDYLLLGCCDDGWEKSRYAGGEHATGEVDDCVGS